MHLNISSVKWQPFCQWGDGLTKRELSMLSDHRNAFSILLFGLIFTSFIETFYKWPQWHWIKCLNIIDVMVWFLLAKIAWAKGKQYFICCILCSRPCSFFQELIFVMSLYWILFQTNETALVKVMTWHITGSKTLREPVITQLTDPCTCMLHFA